MKKIIVLLVFALILFAGCAQNSGNPSGVGNKSIQSNSSQIAVQQPAKITILTNRDNSVPANATKMTPSNDVYPPKLHSADWETPVPMPSGINTAGAEDSPFVTPDGNTLYFFFTPDPSIPVQKQLLDGVTGIWVSKKINGQWSKAERVVLQEQGKLSLDGCEFVQGNIIWFCSAREGYTGINWFTADYNNGAWQNFRNVSEKFVEYEVGELHFSKNGNELYFHSSRAGGKGNYDIWVSKIQNGILQPPANIVSVNSAENDGWPFISEDESELWFLRTYLGSPAIYRSKKINGTWSSPELIVSQFAGEPSLDIAGNLYFVHHYYKNGTMLEADIYMAKKK